MFMACCDWEDAIKEEKAEQESGQKISTETQPMQGDQNNGIDDITNHHIKKRKLKMDLKTKNKNDLLATEE